MLLPLVRLLSLKDPPCGPAHLPRPEGLSDGALHHDAVEHNDVERADEVATQPEPVREGLRHEVDDVEGSRREEVEGHEEQDETV